MRILKYDVLIEDTFYIYLPKRHEVLAVQMQHGKPYMWVEVDETTEKEKCRFHIIGTGNPYEDEKHYLYIGTFQMYDGELVWHLFESWDIE
jgi:hypothetical protein